MTFIFYLNKVVKKRGSGGYCWCGCPYLLHRLGMLGVFNPRHRIFERDNNHCTVRFQI